MSEPRPFFPCRPRVECGQRIPCQPAGRLQPARLCHLERQAGVRGWAAARVCTGREPGGRGGWHSIFMTRACCPSPPRSLPCDRFPSCHPIPADYLELKSTITSPSLPARFRGSGVPKYGRSLRVWQLPDFTPISTFSTRACFRGVAAAVSSGDAGQLADWGRPWLPTASWRPGSPPHPQLCHAPPAAPEDSNGFMTVQFVGQTGVAVSGALGVPAALLTPSTPASGPCPPHPTPRTLPLPLLPLQATARVCCGALTCLTPTPPPLPSPCTTSPAAVRGWSCAAVTGAAWPRQSSRHHLSP